MTSQCPHFQQLVLAKLVDLWQDITFVMDPLPSRYMITCNLPHTCTVHRTFNLAGPRRDLNFRVVGHVDCVGQLGGRVLHAVFAAAVLQSHAGGPGAAEATGAGPRGVRPRPVTVFVSNATQHATQNRSYPVHLQKMTE